MTRATRNLAILAIVTAALIAAVLWVGRRDYRNDPPTLTGLDPANVTRIELDIPGIAAQAFAKRADGWWRVKPSEARDDDARVQRLANLATTPVARWLPAAKITPARIGLEHPSATLAVNNVRIEYGGLAAIGELRYVRVGDKVALVPRQYSPEVLLTKAATEGSP